MPCRLERGRGSAETSRATKTRQAVTVLYVLPTIWICFCSCEGYDPAAKKAAAPVAFVLAVLRGSIWGQCCLWLYR